MTDIVEFLKGFSLQNIICMIAVMWYFTREVLQKIEVMDRDLRAMNTRLSRTEGTVYGQDLYELGPKKPKPSE